jgi:hypothetical protein
MKLPFSSLAMCLPLDAVPGVAQGVYQSGDPNAPPSEVFQSEDAPAAKPAEDLKPYLTPDGRFIDQCRFWHDHPDALSVSSTAPTCSGKTPASRLSTCDGIVADGRGTVGRLTAIGEPSHAAHRCANCLPPSVTACAEVPRAPIVSFRMLEQADNACCSFTV